MHTSSKRIQLASMPCGARSDLDAVGAVLNGFLVVSSTEYVHVDAHTSLSGLKSVPTQRTKQQGLQLSITIHRSASTYVCIHRVSAAA